MDCTDLEALQLPVRPASLVKLELWNMTVRCELDLHACSRLEHLLLEGCSHVGELHLPASPLRLETSPLISCPVRCQVNPSTCARLKIRLLHCPAVILLQLLACMGRIALLAVKGLAAHCVIHPDTRALLLEYARHHPSTIQLPDSPTLSQRTDAPANASAFQPQLFHRRVMLVPDARPAPPASVSSASLRVPKKGPNSNSAFMSRCEEARP